MPKRTGLRRRSIGVFARTLLVILAVLLPMAVGFVHFVMALPPPTTDMSETDAIVVLTGGGDRIPAALTLLQEGKAKKLFVSGVHKGVDVDALLRVDSAPSQKPDAALAKRIELGDMAADTFGNSIESVAWMRANNFKSLRLVTADYHIRRALIEFRMEAPDLVIVPNPIHPAGIVDGRWWRDRSAVSLLLGEYGKYLIVRWRFLLTRLLPGN
jgi:uncharacterized SAM-binding protein YcdF (DUF218 family)